MEQLLPDWPPDYDQNGDPYPADAGDEWRYKLGVYNAQIGNYQGAVQYFQEVINTPTDPLSKWVQEASVFLANYKSAGDVYKACIRVDECNPSDALDFILNQAGRDSSQDAFEYLYQEDVPLRATGFFDFELDDVRERWFTVQHRPLEQLELWILASSRSGDVGYYISPVEENKPTFSYLDEAEDPPIVYVSNELAIRLNRDPDTFYPFIEFPVVEIEYTDPFVEGMNQARDELLSGGDPDAVIKMLKDLAIYPGLLCASTQTCDPYYYYLGLAYELDGNEDQAVETYLFLWQNYILSPFTSMARLKMAGTITPTPPTPTAVATPSTLTPTPPVIATPTPTGGIVYPTPTITNTFPPPVYPYPRP
jgi:tetratricopeptide (TPR) repeat protein